MYHINWYMSIKTIEDIEKIIDKFYTKKYEVFLSDMPGTINIKFYSCKWYNFILRYKIEKLKKYLNNNRPICILFVYEIISSKGK